MDEEDNATGCPLFCGYEIHSRNELFAHVAVAHDIQEMLLSIISYQHAMDVIKQRACEPGNEHYWEFFLDAVEYAEQEFREVTEEVWHSNPHGWMN